MARLVFILLVLVSCSFARSPEGTWKFAQSAAIHNTAWNKQGTLVRVEGVPACVYTGQIVLPPNREGTCSDILILHLADATAMENNGKIIGLHCAYDWAFPDNGGHFMSNDVLREDCPDILATVDGGFTVVGEYWFKPGENQTIYYEDGVPIRQHLSNAPRVLDRFDKKFEDQVRYRDTYNWLARRPGSGWDSWERPGSVHGERTGGPARR
jgi:hypothetical protein